MELLKQILKQIKPSKEEEAGVKEKVDIFLKKINPNLKDAEAALGGSGAKGTWLAGAHDVDIYVSFDYEKYKDISDKLSDILEKILKKIFPKVTRLHGSRDYFQIKEDKFTFEIIPILKIDSPEKALNITDISPLHVRWVSSHQEYSDEVRLTKQFCKANNVYGAESYIRGFSGYDCEVLTIYYKGFLNLIKAAAKWTEKVILDPEKHYKNEKDALQSLNIAKIYAPLILIDPVQAERNVAAALNKEKFSLFKQACKQFLKKPAIDFFKVKEISIKDIKHKAKSNKLILLDAVSLKGKEDVIGSKLLKAYEHIAKQLIKNDFKIIEKGWTWDKEQKALFWYILDKKPLLSYKKWIGPPMQAVHHVMEFKKAHKGDKIYIEKNRVCADVKRKFIEPEPFTENMIKKDPYILERVKEIKLLL